MNLVLDLIPPRPAAVGQPCPAFERPREDAPMAFGDTETVGGMLADLLHDESALYAITREWRYDTAARKFLQLYALLDDQFSEIGIHLTRLAARSRDLGCGSSTGDSERLVPPRAAVVNDALPAPMIRELLSLHEKLVARLKRGSLASEQSHDRETTNLLAELTANHEKDAFMLRALLWEVENITP